jgi:hypothetical protein
MKRSVITWLAIPTSLFFTTFPTQAAELPEKSPADVEISPGIWADPTCRTPASAALQQCLDNEATSRHIELPKGIYQIDRMLVVKHSNTTFTTQGLANTDNLPTDGDPDYAILKAAPTLDAEALLRSPKETTGLVLDHLLFDGNRSERLANASPMAAAKKGRTVIIQNGEGTRIRGCGFYRTVCGTALGLGLLPAAAKNVSVTKSVFADNGRNIDKGLWSDGLTIGSVEGAEISDNQFLDNSDVSLILGGGVNTTIRRNLFRQTKQRAFAAFMLTNWSAPAEKSRHQHADFRGLVFENNTLDLQHPTDIGLQIGVVTWTAAPSLPQVRTLGGTLARNTISTKGQGINIAGGGTLDFPVVLRENTIHLLDPRAPGGFTGQIKTTSALNIQNPNTDSFATGDTQEATNVNWNMLY